MRIATYNVEWFANLFDEDGALLRDTGWSGRRDVKRYQQIEALGEVFRAMDADAIMVIEAPDSSRFRSGRDALETFARHFNLRTNKAVIGFRNDTQQEIMLLYDPSVLSACHDPIGPETAKAGQAIPPRFDGVFHIDLDVDATADSIQFSKPPLELQIETDRSAFRMIGVHAKSKAPHGARGAAEVMRISIANRRKQLAQCIWLRRRVEQHLEAKDPLIVLGDFNDGPGLDEYEKLFGRSGVEIVLGEQKGVQLYDPHAEMALNRRLGAAPVTSRFYIAHQKRYLQALLDYVMVSPDLRAKAPVWRIWHPFDDPECYDKPSFREALLTASDHFPVTIDIDL